ncbi:MAG: porin family protein [Elusimicrobiota bacterium]|jgi:hypothetical protein|nr:porin family protein [Elusimicrobiota bacterium]
MRKLVTAVFAVALLVTAAVSASAYEFTIGGQVGYFYQKEEINSNSEKGSGFSIAPEFAKIIDEDTNVGIGLKYVYEDTAKLQSVDPDDRVKATTLGVYLFGERAVLNPGPFKVFLRGDIGYDSTKYDGNDDRENVISVGILPNVQYALSDRLTLIVSSDVLRLGFIHGKKGDNKVTNFGFNVGDGDIASVGLKFAF